MPTPSIPDKLYFSIGEVSEIVGVAPHVLRYWESEFPSVRPVKRRGNRRLYRRQEVETLLKIRYLLYERRFTIAGARAYLRRKGETDPMELLRTIRDELMEIRQLLRSPE